MKFWIGIDPGASGAMCILTEENHVVFIDFKYQGLTGYIKEFKEILADEIPTMIAIEKVRAMPGQGVSSMLSLGRRVGELEGMLQTLEIGYVEVRPQEWQKLCGVVPKSGKKGTYEAISKIYPQAQLNGPKGGLLDGRCDALGIAHYLRKTY